jgi:hypothetical protein
MGWFKKLTGGIFEPISHALAGVDDTVRENIPGGWTIPALLAGGYMFAPEIGAFFNPASGATVTAGEVAGGEAAINSALTSGGLASPVGATNALAGGEALSAMPTNYMGAVGGADAASSAFPLTSGMGLSTGAEATGLSQYLNPSYLTPAAIAGSALLGTISSSQAAKAQQQAAQQQAATNLQIFNQQKELQAPWQKAGEAALNKLLPLSMNYTPFGMNQFQQDPGYGFRLTEGMKALDRTAAARGGLLSGSTLKGAQRYGQDLASQEYQNAFNRYQTERAAQLNPLQSLAGLGQSAAGTLTNAAGTYGANQNEAIANTANARQSAYMGPANAVAGGVNQYLNYAGNSALTNALLANRGIA